MKSEHVIKREIENYKEVIKEFPSPEDYDIRDRYKAKIYALEWALDEE